MLRQILPALVALRAVAAASSDDCDLDGTVQLNAQADFTKYADCTTLTGGLRITSAGAVDLTGPTKITGDLVVDGNRNITNLSSSSIQSIGGVLKINDAIQLSSLSFSNLSSVGTLQITGASGLGSVTFAPLTSAGNVTIADTFVETLDMLDLDTVGQFNINNNKRLAQMSSNVTSITEILEITAFGVAVQASFQNLKTAKEVQINNVTSFAADQLANVTNSISLNSNYFTNVSLPKLTKTGSSFSMIGNSNLQEAKFDALETIGGGLQIANNTDLAEINGFSKLSEVDGAVKLRGVFTSCEFPAITVVKGATDISSTEDITSSCDAIKKNNAFQVTPSCTSKNATANSDTSGSTGTGSDDDDSAAAGFGLNFALLGLTALAGVALGLW